MKLNLFSSKYKLPIECVNFAYKLILNRPVDEHGKISWLEIIEKNQYSKMKLVDTLLSSNEYLYKTKKINRFATLIKMKSILDFVSEESITSLQKTDIAYKVFLYRKIDKNTSTSIEVSIQNGKFSIYKLIFRLVFSSEYNAPERKPPMSEQLHLARVQWVYNLPSAKSILDIGGSSPTLAEGALIELGYAHRPENLIIFDKPPNEQFWGTPNYSQANDLHMKWGVIKYIHGYAEDILNNAELHDKKFDIIFMGQVVEHIYEEKLHEVLTWIRSHLSETGVFYFDTPNRRLTVLQTGPDNYIDPDHKKEYTPDEMKSILSLAGFEVIQEWGIVDMPLSLKCKIFDNRDFYQSQLLSENADSAYCFAMACKPIC